MDEVEQVNKYVEMGAELIMTYGPPLVLAIVTLLAGLWIINRFCRLLDRGFERSGMEMTLRRFLNSLSNIVLKGLLLISVASILGIETTSFIAVLGAAGLAIGLALQGSMAHFSGGVLILILRPYKVGEFVEAAGQSGIVKKY